MNPDLDQLRQRWQAAHQAALPQLALDLPRLRQQLLQRSQLAFARHRRWLLVGLCAQLLVCGWLGQFALQHAADAVYRFLALPLLGLALAQLLVSLRQWQQLRRLDLSAPVSQVRATLEGLRALQLRLTRWIALSSVWLWMPLLLVLCKSVLEVDLLDYLHPSVVYVNLGLGLAWWLAGEALLRTLARRWQDQPWLRRWLLTLTARSWQQAEQQYDAQAALDDAQDEDALALAMAREQRRAALPPQLAAPLQRLRRRLLAAITFWSLCLLAIGLYNASVGGIPSLLIPGVLLNGWLVAQLVASIVHRQRLSLLDPGDPALGETLAAWAASQLRVASVSLALLPLAALLLLQVLGQLLGGHDLALALPWPLQALLAALVVGASAWLLRPPAQRRLAQPARALLWGVAGLSEALRAALSALR